jgi:hypothetical protein
MLDAPPILLPNDRDERPARQEPASGRDKRLSPRAAILVIGGLSLALWSAVIGVAVLVF